MHELSIALEILDLAAIEAAKHGAVRVSGIHLMLGPLSGVVKEALLAVWEMAQEQSALPEARLIVEETPIRIQCGVCRDLRTVTSPQSLCCADCGTPATQLVGGRELEICALDIQ